jgi:hypothetical protein
MYMEPMDRGFTVNVCIHQVSVKIYWKLAGNVSTLVAISQASLPARLPFQECFCPFLAELGIFFFCHIAQAISVIHLTSCPMSTRASFPDV